MKEIKGLLEKNTRVWVYLRDEETTDLFLDRAENEGFRFADGEVPRARRTDMYAVYPGRLNTLNFIGHLALQCNAKYVGTEVLKIVDYRKYIENDKDYLLN